MEGPKNMLEKLELASPYNIFYNSIPEVQSTFRQWNSITFGELLCPSLGELKCSLFITAKVDIQWLMGQFEEKNVGNTPISLLYFDYKPEMEKYIENNLPNVTQHCFSVSEGEAPINHHSRIGIFVYKDDTLRVHVSTVNLTQIQWDHFNHAIWLSPLCHPLPETSPDSEGESPTNFKSSLLNYLHEYKLPEILTPWIEIIKRTDFTSVKVFLVTSVPGVYPLDERKSQSQKIEDLFKKHCKLPKGQENSWGVIAQASCLGRFGDSPKDWLKTTFLRSLSCHTRSGDVYMPSTPLKIIFPTWLQVKRGLFDMSVIREGLRYSRSLSDKQIWVKDYLYIWKADVLDRSGIMPHTKTYCRVSPSGTKMAWFFLSTSNINRGSWGNPRLEDNQIYVRNYETGVLFFPEFFDEDYFNIDRRTRGKIFPLIYDLPLLRYRELDHPWTGGSYLGLNQKRV